MRNLLEDDEAIQGMQYLNRATLLIHEAKNPELILYFKLCQARILDASRKFLEAAVKYRILPILPSCPLSSILCLVSLPCPLPSLFLLFNLNPRFSSPLIPTPTNLRRRLLRTPSRRIRTPKMSLRSNHLRRPRPRRSPTFPHPRNPLQRRKSKSISSNRLCHLGENAFLEIIETTGGQ